MGNQEDSGAGSSSVNDVLENNSDLQQVRKSGKLSENSKALSKFGLSVDQTDRFHSLSDSAQSIYYWKIGSGSSGFVDGWFLKRRG